MASTHGVPMGMDWSEMRHANKQEVPEIDEKDKNYAFEQMNGLLQYTDKKSRWSPNNIRRVIISPDAIFMLRHFGDRIGKVEIQYGGYNSVKLDPQRYAASLQDPKVKSIIDALMHRVPMLLEEVVVCKKGSFGNDLVPIDKDLNGLLIGYKGARKGSTEETIKARYKRLAAYIEFDGTYKEFLSGINKDLNEKGNYLLSKDEFVKQAVSQGKCKVYALNSDWYKACMGNPDAYPEMDCKGGPINAKLEKIRDHMKKQLDNKAFEDFKKENGSTTDLTKEKEAFQKAYNNANTTTKVIEDFMRLHAKVGVLPYCDGVEMFNLTKTALVESENIDKKTLSHAFKIEGKVENEKDALEQNTKTANAVGADLYTKLLTLLFDVLDHYKSYLGDLDVVTPITEGFDRSIMVPPALEIRNQALAHPFQGKRLKDSLANICTLLASLYLKENPKQTKTAWVEQ